MLPLTAAADTMAGPAKPTPVKLERQRLDAAGVTTHFASLAAEALAIEIRTKSAATGYSDASNDQLDQAARRLCDGDVSAVQVRFCKGGDWWCDTVMRVGNDFRLVRMRQVDPTAT